MVAIAFDVDGVLIDSVSVHRRVWATWAKSHGLEVDAVWQATFGRRPEDTVMEIGQRLDPVSERRALDRLLAAHEHRIEALPGAKALSAGIAAGRAAGCWVLAVATTQPRAALAAADEVHENLQDVTTRLMTLLPTTG